MPRDHKRVHLHSLVYAKTPSPKCNGRQNVTLITYLAAFVISWSSTENEELRLKSPCGPSLLLVAVCACMIGLPASTSVFKPGVKSSFLPQDNVSLSAILFLVSCKAQYSFSFFDFC